MEGGREGGGQLFGGWSTVARSTLSFLAQLMQSDVLAPDVYSSKLKSLHCDYPPAPVVCARLEHHVMRRVVGFGSLWEGVSGCGRRSSVDFCS